MLLSLWTSSEDCKSLVNASVKTVEFYLVSQQILTIFIDQIFQQLTVS
jgi:hypothetical protein